MTILLSWADTYRGVLGVLVRGGANARHAIRVTEHTERGINPSEFCIKSTVHFQVKKLVSFFLLFSCFLFVGQDLF